MCTHPPSNLDCMVFAATIAAGLLIATPSAAQIYKWVDEKGVTHYTAEPPPEKKAQKMQAPPPGAGTGAPASSSAPSAKSQDLEFRQRQIAREQKEREEAKARERKQADCPDARRHLARLQEQISLYQRNDKGERVYLEDKDRPAEMARVQSFIDRNCR